MTDNITTSGRIITILRDVTGDHPARIYHLQEDLQKDTGLDSLGVLEFAMSLEEEFGLEIPDEDAARLHTLGDWIAYVDRRTTA